MHWEILKLKSTLNMNAFLFSFIVILFSNEKKIKNNIP